MNVEHLYGPVTVAPSSVVGKHCVLGYPKEARLREHLARSGSEAGAAVTIGERCLIFNHVTIYEDTRIGDDCVLEDAVRIGYGGRIGNAVRLLYAAYICDRVTIGAHARVAGFVCDGTTIGPRSTAMGELVHEYTRPHRGWWEVDEDAPVIESDVVIGFGARVVGGVRVGPCSYVAAGAVVTKDVPPEQVVTGINVHTPATDWPGQRLRELIGHWRAVRSST